MEEGRDRQGTLPLHPSGAGLKVTLWMPGMTMTTTTTCGCMHLLKCISSKTWRASSPATFVQYSANRVIAGVSSIQMNLRTNVDPASVIYDQWRVYKRWAYLPLENTAGRKHISDFEYVLKETDFRFAAATAAALRKFDLLHHYEQAFYRLSEAEGGSSRCQIVQIVDTC